MAIIDTPTKAQRDAAYRVMRRAIKRGDLVRATACEWCGGVGGKIQGHHPDYARPLMVVWLCVRCHAGHHSAHYEDRRIFNIFAADRAS